MLAFLSGGPELFIVAGVVFVLFGGSQLPKLARSLREARDEFEGVGAGDPAEPVAELPPHR